MPNNYMSKSDASRVQSTQAQNGGNMSSGGFASRAQSAADRNAAAGNASQGYCQSSQGTGAGQQSQGGK